VIREGASGCASNRDVIIDGNSAEAQPPLSSATGIDAITGWAGNRPVVVAAGRETVATIYSGSGDMKESANWNNVRVRGATFNPSLASGPRGLFLLQGGSARARHARSSATRRARSTRRARARSRGISA
jgi:hypothetical protein